MILFLCETLYTLLNAIHIKCKCFPDTPADVLLTKTGKFDDYVEKVRALGIFEDVILSDFSSVDHMDNLRHKIGKLLKNPTKYEYALKSPKEYTDYFMPVATSDYEKFLYYQMAMSGTVPKVHFYDEGMLTYYADINGAIESDSINHSRFPYEMRFSANIKDIYVYEPALVSIPNNRFPVVQIPKLDIEDTEYMDILVSVFGLCDIPKEQYIFLEECFWTEKKNTNEIDILDKVAERVGKENIIVKLHPRTVHDVFALHGYKTFLESNIPWEMFMMHPDFKNKILLTVSSGSAMTAKLMYGQDCNSIYLWKMMKLSQRYHIKVKNFLVFFKRAMQTYNEERRNLFCPGSMLEFDITLKYIEGRL